MTKFRLEPICKDSTLFFTKKSTILDKLYNYLLIHSPLQMLLALVLDQLKKAQDEKITQVVSYAKNDKVSRFLVAHIKYSKSKDCDTL